MKLTYRPDIDGLRAVAVLAVILYHLDIKPFTGGFVGVDVFFVISGYLITTIIMWEIVENQFSLIKFYERRIRRIFPALFVVLLATVIVSAVMFHDPEFKLFGQSLSATTLFVSNFHFWSESDYFDGPSILKPLLHTWSLAVEEQYYIFFPLLIVFLSKYLRSALKFILLGIAAASFVFSVRNLYYDASGTFYLAHTRVWELLIGSLLATNIIPIRINVPIRHVLSVVGLAMVMAAVFLYTNDTPFPGRAALLPTLGTALIIYSGIEGETFVSRLLSLKPIVFIGKISYSLYLWHWPVIVFARYYTILELNPIETVAILVFIFVLSILSWQFIEKPFRQRALLTDRRIFGYAATVMVLMFICGVAIDSQNGFPNRFADVNTRQGYEDVQKWQECTVTNQKKNLSSGSNFCSIGKNTNKPTFLLLGDSHASAIAPAVQASASRAGVGGIIVYKSTCPPLTRVYIESSACVDFVERIMTYVRNHPNLRTVILVSRWAIYTNGTYYKSEPGKSLILRSATPRNPTQPITNAGLLNDGLDKTITRLLKLGRRVIIVNEIPEIGYNVPSAFFLSQRIGKDLNKIIAPSMDEYIDRNKVASAIFQSLAQKKHIQILEPSKVLCASQRCLVIADGHYLYADDDHLSVFGAQYISSIFDIVFENPVDR